MDATTRLVLSRIMAEGRCIVCNAPARDRQIELEQQIQRGCCPICGAAPEAQDNVIAQYEFDQARLTRERKRAADAKQEEAAQLAELEELTGKHKTTLLQWERVQESIESRKDKNRQLRARLPQTVRSKDYESELRNLRRDHDRWQALRTSRQTELRTLFAERQGTIAATTNELVMAFSSLMEALLVEEVRLVQVKAQPRYLESPGRSGERVEVPAYSVDMRGAARTALTRRNEPSEVSESQRELIDLAFRLALLAVFGGATTFAMETPEASLDGISMERVGKALAGFATNNGNRLVVTSNLTNAGIVTAMFEATEPEARLAARLRRVLNLLEVATPNRALLEDRDRYHDLLAEAVGGTNQ